ncbi:MAG: hypothetical protein ABI635_11550, partial [Actinomycetota bacterium]
ELSIVVVFGASGLAIFLTLDTQGRAFADEGNDFRWYVLMPGFLALLQLVGGLLLGRREGAQPGGEG